MTTKVTLNFCDTDMEFSHTPWDAADMAIYEVNRILKERGIDIEFTCIAHGEEDFPEKYWNEEHPDYTTDVSEITEE